MADTHETVADIIAEMRKYKEVDPNLMWDNSQVEEHDLHYADRLDAAHKRERGNAAKLREALSDACYAMFNFLKSQNGGYEEMASALDKAKAALAAPARNCDKYSHDEALRIWSAEPENPMNGCFDVWLYAPATEKEGGVK